MAQMAEREKNNEMCLTQRSNYVFVTLIFDILISSKCYEPAVRFLKRWISQLEITLHIYVIQQLVD